ncbi:MAG: hypothetical protein ACE5IJ_11240, partial [Thermoplasmata archaeon]
MDDIRREIIGMARAANLEAHLKEGAMCDSCLGRLFGRVGSGFTNSERGTMVREGLNIAQGGSCSLCEGLMVEIPKFAKLVESSLSEFECRTFLIGSRVDHDVVEKEESLWSELGLEHAEPIKTEINRET